MKSLTPRTARGRVEPSRIEKQARSGPEPGGSSAVKTDLLFPLGIFLLAFSLRFIYLFQIEAIPLFYNLASDARSYDEWAQRIVAGDWLGQGVFYQAPLYPYFLALLQFVIGHDLWSIRVVQILLGSLSCVLLYAAGKSFLSRGAGIAAGLMLSLYAPAIFFDALIQKTVVDLFLITVLLFLLSGTQQGSRWVRWMSIGAVLALLGLTRENALIWLFVVPVWIWFYFAERPRWERLEWIGIFLVGAILILLPVGVRNLKVGGEFTLTTSQFGPNFFIGNNPMADGTYMPLRGGHGDPRYERQDATELAEQALGRSLLPGEVSSYWLQRSLEYIRSQPIDWLGLMWRKWLLTWNVRELEDADDFYLYQDWSWLLRVLGWASHFGALAPLAAMGVVLTWKEWRKLWLLYALLGTIAVSVALFYVFGRYRFPMVPLLTIFAGAGLVKPFPLFKEGRVRPLLAGTAALLLTAAVVHWPLFDKPGPSAAAYSNLGNAFLKQGRMDKAIESYQQALRVEPDLEEAEFGLGNLFAAQGKLDDARRHYQEALRIDPDFREAHNNLGNVLASQGDLENAIQHFRQALELGPAHSETHFNLANALARQGRLIEAVGHFQQALKINPDFARAYLNLGRVEASQGQLDKAIGHFQQALRIQPQLAEAHESIGRALAMRGKKDEAVQHYREAVRILKSRRDPQELR